MTTPAPNDTLAANRAGDPLLHVGGLRRTRIAMTENARLANLLRDIARAEHATLCPGAAK